MKINEGICHICCNYKKLSYEHIPPRKAFNDIRVKYKGKTLQRGLGGYTLCEDCNNKMGAYYLNEFVTFVELIACVYKMDEKYKNSNFGTLEIKENTVNFFLLAKACLSCICSLLPIKSVKKCNLNTLLEGKWNTIKGRPKFDILIALSTDLEGGLTLENKNIDTFNQKITVLDYWPLKILFVEDPIKNTEEYYYNFVSIRNFLKFPEENKYREKFYLYRNKNDFITNLLNKSSLLVSNLE